MEEKYKKFKHRFEKILGADKSIQTRMFLFGLLMRSHHYEVNEDIRRDRLSLKPLDEAVKKQWDYDILRKIQNGSDSISEYDDIPDGILFLVHQLNQAIKFDRPGWGFFYLLGTARGMLNSGEIKNGEFQYCHHLLPFEFVKDHGRRIAELSDYFDDVGRFINFDLKDDKVIAYLSESPSIV